MARREKIETVLVATDFSESAEGAIDWAVEVARPHGAKLVLAHALLPPAPMVAAPEAIPLPVEVYAEDRRRCKEELAERAGRLRGGGSAVDTLLVEGPAARALLEASEKCSADLIVAGTRGQTGLKRVFLGSTASLLVRHAKIPVLTVHPEHVKKHRPIRRILVPTDYSDDAELALREAVRVLGAVSASARVVLLHVYRLQREVVYPWTPPPLVHRSNEVAYEARKRLGELAEPIRKLGFDVEVLAQEGYPSEVIDEEAKRIGADLIAMGTHGRSRLRRLVFGSVAERVLPAAPCPVLTVHEEEAA
jgi:nucleotide-binding universal stress UspA family protein